MRGEIADQPCIFWEGFPESGFHLAEVKFLHC
jgi:hypothetical protein